MAGSSPVVDAAREAVLAWFAGKCRSLAEEALDLLADCEASGQWLPGASRRVLAALGHANVAVKMMRSVGGRLGGVGHYDEASEGRWGHLVEQVMLYGTWKTIGKVKVDFEWIEGQVGGEAEEVVRAARRYWRDFAPLADLARQLDATRPRPVVTLVGASSTVTETMAGVGLVAATLRVCPIRWERVETVLSSGEEVVFHYVGYLEWPPGTLHRTSRYAGEGLCHACGHRIKNVFNWVPFLFENQQGVPCSLWVGKDCAETLFGVKVRGVMELDSSAKITS